LENETETYKGLTWTNFCGVEKD